MAAAGTSFFCENSYWHLVNKCFGELVYWKHSFFYFISILLDDFPGNFHKYPKKRNTWKAPLKKHAQVANVVKMIFKEVFLGIL